MGRISIRRSLFWLLDFIKGNPIRNHYQDIKEMMENRLLAEKRTKIYLKRLLDHSKITVGYYKPFFAASRLEDFPVISKQTIKEDADKFISSDFKNKPLHYMKTSGSTGTPFSFPQNIDKRRRVLASLIYFGQLAGYEIGMKKVYFGVWSDEERKTRWSNFKTNMIVIDILRLSDEQLEQMRNKLKRNKKIRCVLGYASTLDRLAKYLLKKGDYPEMFCIETIISSAEQLQEQTRKNLINVFGCDVISRYSNSENGILAQECRAKLKFHINTADFIFEILKMDSDEPVGDGELGRIVVTDLFNYAMPLIRYDTGDIGVLDCRHRCDVDTIVFKSIDGRKIDILYDTKGQPISPLWDFDFDHFEDLNQFQFIQENKKDYLVKVNGAKGNYPDEIFVKYMKNTLGDDANIRVVHVNDIPVLSSGKFKQNICKYHKS